MPSPKPIYFTSPQGFRDWLDAHHATADELWVGFHKVATGRPSLTWPESVDEALCYGWIDGVRRTVDQARYTIRFTPRRRGSHWSAVNIRRVRALQKQGRMRPAGLKAFRTRHASRAQRIQQANRPAELPAVYLRVLKANARAWEFHRRQPPWYRRAAAGWVVGAVHEETRLRRLHNLIRDAAAGRPIRPLARVPKAK